MEMDMRFGWKGRRRRKNKINAGLTNRRENISIEIETKTIQSLEASYTNSYTWVTI
jgi:hypothetical protein